MLDIDIGGEQVWSALEEHLANRDAIQHHGADGTREQVGRACMELIAGWTGGAVVGDSIYKLGFAQRRNELNVALPALRPAEVGYEFKGLAEGEIAGRDPGTVQTEKSLEGREIATPVRCDRLVAWHVAAIEIAVEQVNGESGRHIAFIPLDDKGKRAHILAEATHIHLQLSNALHILFELLRL